MEVHHHAHTSRKKWTDYFWEFFMLFLAVFCGFLAENMREHYIEHKREKKYMRALIDDLASDSLMLNRYVARMAEQGAGLDTLIMALNKPLTDKKNLALIYVLYLKYGEAFYAIPFNENTSSQLKTGGLRLIRDEKIQAAINEYESYKKNVTENSGNFYRLVIEIETQHSNHLFDFTSSPSIIHLTENVGFGMNTDSLVSVSEKDSLRLLDSSHGRVGVFRNSVRSLKAMNANLLQWTRRALNNNRKLREAIKLKYHFN